jgi:peptidoglycan/xylan/chitin deacetylase (PgdA/CDA1 family)
MGAGLPRRLFVMSGGADSRSIHLTFDDGPHPSHTPRLLDVLRQHGARATFFIVGRNAQRHPEIVRRIAAEGHAIGNHSYSHGQPSRTSARQLLDEVSRTRELLEHLTDQPITLFRPPHGKVTAAKLTRLWLTGQCIVLWNVDPKDFQCTCAGELSAKFQANPVRGGDVVLLHDTVPHAIEVLPQVIEAAHGAGLRFETLTSLLQRDS